MGILDKILISDELFSGQNRTPTKEYFSELVDSLFDDNAEPGDQKSKVTPTVAAPATPQATLARDEATLTDADFAGPTGSLWLPSAVVPGGAVEVRWDMREPSHRKKLREVEISLWLSILLSH